MATYRLEAKIIGRSSGGSAIAAAAYRSGSRLIDRYTGEAIDYTRRHGVAHEEILTPDHAPAFASREDLWNSVHDCERRSARWAGVAQLAREFTLSLPHELDDEARLALVRGFVREEFVSRGLVADVAIHRPDPGGDERNYHAHVMTPTRALSSDGFARKLRELNTRDQLLRWRQNWALHVNDALERANVTQRVDHRSLRAQGSDREPEPKQGPLATQIERSGRRTHAGDDRRNVRNRNEAREARRRAERVRAGPSIDRIVTAAFATISPLIAPARDLVAELARAAQRLTISHPAHDRSPEWTAQLLSRRYGEQILSSALAREWTVTTTKRGIMFSRGTSKLLDTGARLSIGGDAPRDVAAVLDLAEQKGWTAIKVESGTAAFRVAVMAAALQRGLDVIAKGDDRKILDQLRRLHAQRASALDRTVPAGEREFTPPADRRAAENATQTIVREAFQLLTQQQSTFTRKDLERTLERFAATPDHLAELLVAAQTDPEVRSLGPDEYGHERFSTGVLFAKEDRLLAQALDMARSTGFAVDATFCDRVIEKKGLKPQQIGALNVCTAANRFALLVGLAGTGKSYLMGAAREVLEQAGYDVVGGALAGVATDNLAKEAGIKDARTIAAWRVYLERNTFGENTVFIGDEWGMVGSDDAAEITRALADAGGKMIVIGDGLQLQPIAAGGAFRALVDRLPPENVARLDDVRRQKEEWMREATRFFGNGDPRAALQLYEKHDRFVEHETRDDAKAAIVAAWVKTHVEHPDKTQLILAYTRADVLDINLRLRAIKRERGELSGPDVNYTTGSGERAFAVHDRVFFTEPSKQLGVRNGTRAIVTGVDPEATTLTVRIPEQNNRELKVTVAEYSGIDYSDCSTTHRAQGQTVDVAHFLATAQRGMAMDLAYVAMSRHREDVHLYWSRDQFKSVGQVYRVLCRFQPKDYTLDYSIDGCRAGYGLGTPMQGPGGVAMRATFQIRGELAAVLRTAAHLRDTVSDEQRDQAQRAYGNVTGWFARVDAQLRDLEARGIRGVSIVGSATALHDRMDLLERSVQEAADRAKAAARAPQVTLDRDAITQRLAGMRATLRDRREAIRVELAALPIDAPAAVDVVIAGELERLQREVAAAGGTGEREAAQQSLAAARTRFARADVLEAMHATYQERAELYALHETKKKLLSSERHDIDALLKRIDVVDHRVERIERREFPVDHDLAGVELVDALERDFGQDGTTPDQQRDAQLQKESLLER